MTPIESTPASPDDEERVMLRDSLRRLLAARWPAERAVELAADPEAVSSIWQALCEQGLASLGSEPSEGGLREILIVQEELGRAGCPAPMFGAALANLALRSVPRAATVVPGFRSELHAGKASACFVFGSFDGDLNAGALTVDEGLLDGETALVEGTRGATHFLALAEPGPVLAIVACDAMGIHIRETPGLAMPPLASVRFDRVKATTIHVSSELAEDQDRIASLLLTARAFGAASRGFELAVAYAKERQQFGQPIGRFQALQHKLANSLIALDASRLMLDNSARAHDAGSADWRFYAAAARAYAGPALRQITLETQHTFGAIGLSEEHEAPRHFRRVHADLIRHGGVRRAREELAAGLLDNGGILPEYDLGAAGNAFREEVRAWLKENRPSGESTQAHGYEEWGYDSAFTKLLGLKGWNHLSWPREHGGPGRTPLEQLAFMEEIQRADAPMGGRGDIQAHALMAFGSDEQKAEFLPRLARGEVTFCLGYSEPGAGSDLASMRTSAVRDGDDWVINGQKCWTTAAEKADFIWLAARTDKSGKPHAGISLFIVPMNTPGLSVRPSLALYGHTFCEEFFDNVRVPPSAMVGEPGQGWQILNSALATERMIMGSFIAQARTAFESLAGCVRDVIPLGASSRKDGAVRDRIGALAADVEAGRQLFMQCIAMAEQGSTPVHQAAMSKAYTGELLERLAESALEILGGGGSLATGADGAIAAGRFEQLLRFSPVAVIGGGTNEIQRNLIAQRGLGLPR